jgi:uncharacterized protein (TIGR03435 family)
LERRERHRLTCATAASASVGARGDLALLIDVLADTVERPIVDQTGLSGRFDIDLEWSTVTSTASSNSDAVTVFTALREQLGLKLEPSRSPVDVLVIDSVERPTSD